MLEVAHLSHVYAPASPLLRPLVRAAVREPRQALDDVSFAVAAGEVVGLVGPNGAGKTTLLKAVSTLLEPTSGTVTVDGLDTVHDGAAVRARLGVVLSDDRGLYWRLSAAQNLELFGVLAGVPRRAVRQRVPELLRAVGLRDASTRVFGFSSGMRGRLNLARALVGEPPLLVLDEPNRSLDPLAAKEMADLLRRVADRGVAVLLSSHRLDELTALTDRVVMIVDGTVRFDGAPTALDGTDSAAALLDLLAREVSG